MFVSEFEKFVKTKQEEEALGCVGFPNILDTLKLHVRLLNQIILCCLNKKMCVQRMHL